MTAFNTPFAFRRTIRVELQGGPASVAGSAIHGSCRSLENYHAGKGIEDAVGALSGFYGALVRCCRGADGEAGPAMEAT